MFPHYIFHEGGKVSQLWNSDIIHWKTFTTKIARSCMAIPIISLENFYSSQSIFKNHEISTSNNLKYTVASYVHHCHLCWHGNFDKRSSIHY